ncbi:tetratricopeptide repeat protein [Nitrospirillum iridis]|uniref:Tetratricopeptide (TPR) repeat protein n=1 Tax=Nitrospirillum iridis TaxID=765888 RepID=A0A7X0AZG7_9PROT|nr:tetratricopeptide repeat protein [Nitrospirillum iridis]MBB6252191.1 tetratricopeptide (TPR) repeat protein [Nitrospirillum iridis]
MATVEQALKLALEHHEAGRLAEAEILYGRVVAVAPGHVQALYLWGMVAHLRGDDNAAVTRLERARRLAPDADAILTLLAAAQQGLGRRDAAEALYRQVLTTEPGHAQAAGALGALLLAAGRPAEALAPLATAMAGAPQAAEHPYARAQALDALGRQTEATADYEATLRLAPGFVPAQAGLGLALDRLSRPDQAAAALERVVRAVPAGHPQASHPQVAAARAALSRIQETRATLLRDQGQPDAAIPVHQQALATLRDGGLAPAPDLWNSLGVSQLAAGRVADAVAAFQAAVDADPRYGEALSNLGNALKAAKRLDEAVDSYRRALALFPRVAEIHTNLGTALAELSRPTEALAAYEEAVRLNPAFIGGWLNVGMGRRGVGDLDGAVEAYGRALALDPSFHRAWTALGAALYDLGRFEDAAQAAEKALALKPDSVEANWNLGLVALLLGRHAQGWPLYEWRRHSRTNPLRTFDVPAWDGAPFPGRTLLVHIEQGLGDMLMIARYLPLVAARGGRLLVETPPDLAALFQGMVQPGRLDLAPTDRPLPPFDLQCPVMSLPGLFRAGIDPIPAGVPYLSVDEGRRTHWRDRLAGGGTLKVALVWAGNPNFTGDRWRSPRLPAFAPVLRVPGVRFFSIQMGDGRRDLEGADLPAGFTDLGPDIADFADTAAILTEADLLISSCTAPVHLAGALGRPVWVVLPQAPDWRWGLGACDSAWYPTARLFRQEGRGDWRAVMRRVAGELTELAGLL